LEGHCCSAAYFCMPGLLVVPKFTPALFIQSRQQIERDVRWLEMIRIGVRDVVGKAAERCLARKSTKFIAEAQRCRIAARDQSGSDRFGVAFHTRDLSRQEDFLISLQL